MPGKPITRVIMPILYGLVALQLLAGIVAFVVLPQGEFGQAGWAMILISGSAIVEGALVLSAHLLARGYHASRDVTLPED